MPNSFKMDRLITIQRNTPTINDYGESVANWSDLATVWAQQQTVKALEKWVSQQVKAEIDVKFRIRYRSDVTPMNRLVFEDRVFDIISVSEVGRREALDIIGKARAE
jgi:SPP1 family predicted phage head-tail adaptor